MNFLGMGTLEILVVLFVAFVVLGPERMMNMARQAGKMLGEVSRLNSGLRSSLSLDEDERSNEPRQGTGTPEKSSSPDDAPVTFRPGNEASDAMAPSDTEESLADDQPRSQDDGGPPESNNIAAAR